MDATALRKTFERRAALYGGTAEEAVSLGLGRSCSSARRTRISAKLASEYRNVQQVASAAAARDKALGDARARARKKNNARQTEQEAGTDGSNQKLAGGYENDFGTADSRDVEMHLAGIEEDLKRKEQSNTELVKVGDTNKNNALKQMGAAFLAGKESRALQVRRKAVDPVKPEWHAPWVMKRVIAGHLGWVTSVVVDPTNEFFFTGSADRTIKVWDLASGKLKLTLTGHSHTVSGLAVSERYPYLFSVSEDKSVLCWDLETNKVVSRYHGHLQAVNCVAVHPQLEVIVTAGRDAAARIWDIRTRKEVHLLTGHSESVESMIVQATDPQIITGSTDKTIRFWDLAAGKSTLTLTHHEKGIRALVRNPREYSFASGAADMIKKWEAKSGRLMLNLRTPRGTIVNSLSCNTRDVLFAGGNDGTMRFFDWKSGHCFSETKTIPQPGSLDSEACVLASTFDRTGSRLITCEADKSIKIWQEDPTATEQTHPLNWDRDAAAQAMLNERF